MRAFFLIFAICILHYSYMLGQGPSRVGTNQLILFQQGFVLESLSGFGFSNAAKSSVYNIGSANPALLSDFVKPSIEISYQYNTQIDSFILNDMTFQRVNNFVPQAGGVVYPINDFRIGGAFSQKYSGEMRIEDIPITTPQDPDGTGEYFSYSRENSIYSVSAIAAYQFGNLFYQRDRLSIGLQFNLNYLVFRESLYRLLAKMNASATNWKVGLTYGAGEGFLERFRIGIYMETRAHFSDFLQYDDGLLIHDLNPGNNQIINGIVPQEFEWTTVVPMRFGLGYLIRVSSKFEIGSDFIHTWWEDMGNGYSNGLDFSHSLMYTFSEKNLMSLGFFYSQDNNESPYSPAANAVFLSTGLVYRVGKLEVHLAVADSHIFSGKLARQTVGKMGVGFNL